MRVWQLEHGKYRVRYGMDTSGQESVGDVVMDQTMELARYSPIRMRAPGRQVMVLTVERQERLDPIRKRPDLAIGRKDVAVIGNQIHVTVHNIGGSDAPPSTIQLVRGGKVIAQKRAPALKAPIDLKPKTATLVLDRAGQLRDITVRIIPPLNTDEITTVNNEVPVFVPSRLN